MAVLVYGRALTRLLVIVLSCISLSILIPYLVKTRTTKVILVEQGQYKVKSPEFLNDMHNKKNERKQDYVTPYEKQVQTANTTCPSYVDVSPENLCNFRQVMHTGTCIRNQQTLSVWSSILNKCKENPIPVTCNPSSKMNTIGTKSQITFKVSGRLGNNLYQFAAMYSLAIRHNMTPVMSRHCSVAKMFKVQGVKLVDEEAPGAQWAKFIQSPDYNYDGRTRYLDSSKNIRLCGFFQSHHYIRDIGDAAILEQLQIKDNILDSADHFIRNESREALGVDVIVSDLVYVGIHIRRGDLGSYSYIQPPTETFFKNAMTYYTQRFQDKVVFLVCTQDMKWAKSALNSSRPVIFSEKHSAEVDFAILTRCNHTIRSLGSFGSWAGYLSQGTTVHFNNSVLLSKMGKRTDGTTCDRLDKQHSFFPNLIMMS